MFDDMFDTPEQILSGAKEGAVLSSWERLPRNCADLLPLPEKQRKKGYPMGLKNQGATCYLNSFLQILFYTPQLRKVILELPLCSQNIETKSQFVKGAKHTFLFGFQRLFSEMSLRDSYAVETDYLNKAFGWEGKEHVEQQDMTEAMKIIFDTMERALFGTPYESVMRNLFKGNTARYKACQACTVRSQREEDFYDFVVQVAGVKSLDQALMASLTPQIMDGENKIFCDVCQQKQDMYLGTRFKHFPNILVFTLNRFTFDFEAMDRIKLNSYFEFGLEQKLTHLVDDGKEHDFELYGVIIHRGSAHGGHYFAYIRDTIHESSWQKGIEQAHNEQQKRQKQKQSTQLTEEQKKKKQELQNEDKKHPLKVPENKKLLQNWYDLNDNVVTAIDAQKITSKFQGSQSAYILFYRRKGIPTEQLNIQVPEYFRIKIQQQNKKVKEQREKYQYEKQHIVLKINGNQEKLNVKTTIKTLLQKFCPDDCFALVMESSNNSLPYYPMEFNALEKEFTDQDTIEKHQVFHESIWKTYLVTDDEYLTIKSNIGREKLPFEVNLLLDGNKKKIVLYQDQTLSDFRSKIQKDFQVPYENQIIQLVTPYKEIFLTDNLQKDQVLLTKLGFIHEAQVIVKNLPPDNENYDEQKQAKTQNVDKDLLCFVVERDDQIGIKKFYFSKYETLQSLLNFIMKDIPQKDARRLRNLNGNRLYYIDHYPKQLFQLDICNEEMVKLRVERGQIPVKGDICAKAKLQSKFQDFPENTMIEKVFDPNTTIAQLKQEICAEAKLDPQMHRVYLTDWMGEPVRSITKETQSIFEANFSREQIICLRDIQSPIGSELLHFEVFVTETGSPDNISNDSFHSKSQIHKTVLQFKEKLLEEAYFKGKDLKPKQLRIRELKRDYMFGNVWRSHDRLMKDVQVNTNKLVVQILSHEEELKEDQIVLTLKKRNTEKRLYEGNTELIFEAGKEPKVEDLLKAVREKLQLTEDFPLMVIKYFNYNFEWIQISKQKLEKSANQKKQGGDKGKKDNKKDNKKENQKKNETKKDKNNKETQSLNVQNLEQGKQTPNQEIKSEVQVPTQQPTLKQQATNQPVQQKNQKKKKEKKAPQVPVQKTDFLNLRKPPTLLKDGDWIGWGNSQEIKKCKDDLQTEEDLSLRFIKKSNKNAVVYRRNQGGGFKINVDF